MSTFVELYDFEGITVVPFCTSGGSDIGNSSEELVEQAGNGTWISGRRFSGNELESDLQACLRNYSNGSLSKEIYGCEG